MLPPKEERRGGALRDIQKTAARETNSLYVNENRNN